MCTHVRPVERFIPAKKAETGGRGCQHLGEQRWKGQGGGCLMRGGAEHRQEATHGAQRQRHNGSGVRALTTTPKSASREAGGDL